MATQRKTAEWLFACILAFALSGCGQLTNTVPAVSSPLETHENLSPASNGSTYKVTKGLIFVTLPDPSLKYEDIQVYDAHRNNPAPLAYIRDGLLEPQGACMDSKGTLYVTNVATTGSINEYALGSTTPSKTITQGVSGPTWCTIDRSGNLWVTNSDSVNVTEYLQGSSVPHEVITDGLTSPAGIAIDHAGNLYVANHAQYTSGVTNIQVYHPGHTSPSRTITDGVSSPIGIGVDSAGTLYVTNLLAGNIEEYHSGSSKPFHKITKGMNGPIAVTFAAGGRMYVSNFGIEGGGSGPPDAIVEFPPHEQVPGKWMITQGLYLPGSLAFWPPAAP